MSLLSKTQLILDALGGAYAHCDERADFVAIILDAADQGGMTVQRQKNLRDYLRSWDNEAVEEAEARFPLS